MAALILTGETKAEAPSEDLTRIYGHIFDSGLRAGQANAGNEELFAQLVDAALGCILDEGQPEQVREKSFANLMGFTVGWSQMMLVTPLQFLTRQQTAKVQALPRGVRRAWFSMYRKGLKHWVGAGGSLSGKRPILPAIPE